MRQIILELVRQKGTSALILIEMRNLRVFDVRQDTTCMRIYHASSIAPSDSIF